MTRISALLMTLAITVACGGSTGVELTPEAANGKRIANTNGCASCHGADGSGGVGPGFVGLHGSEVTLTDGSTVIADDEYLRRAITDPDAERVEGYVVSMPTNGLSDEDIEAVLAYIRELAGPP